MPENAAAAHERGWLGHGARGVVVVASAGNAGTETIYYPAGYETVIGVSAVDREKKLYDRSNRSAAGS